MIVLALDTALGLCSVAVTVEGEPVAAASEAMMQGHQERLAPMTDEVMRAAGLEFAALDRIGVTVGPGSFTGLRVGLSFARAIGLALERPVGGVDALEAIALSQPREGQGLVVVDARRGQAWVRRFSGQDPAGPSRAVAIEDLSSGPAPDWIAGPGAGLLAAAFPLARVDARAACDPVALARRVGQVDPAACPPEPLYLRPPDAKLPGGLEPAPS